MEDLFNIEPTEPIRMSQEGFFIKTKALLEKIGNNYSQAWQDRALKDNEYPEESICDKCKGHGTFKENGEERDCYRDNEHGECYHRFCDYEQFGMNLESQLENLHELLSVDELSTTKPII